MAYLFFLLYLRHKDETEYNGPEQAVANAVRDNDTSWIPNQAALVLQNTSHQPTIGPSTADPAPISFSRTRNDVDRVLHSNTSNAVTLSSLQAQITELTRIVQALQIGNKNSGHDQLQRTTSLPRDDSSFPIH